MTFASPSPPPPPLPPPVAPASDGWSLVAPPSCWECGEEEEVGRGGRGEAPRLLVLVPTSSIVWYIVVAGGKGREGEGRVRQEDTEVK